jgi:hypothetical protein
MEEAGLRGDQRVAYSLGPWVMVSVGVVASTFEATPRTQVVAARPSLGDTQ